MFGISGGEFFVILLVIVIVVGPQRLPEYTRKLTQLVRQLRLFIDNAKEQIAEEVGPELGDLSLKDLDPRNYDPRKIVRDVLGEDLDAIRKDLTSPFESVISTAKKTSDDAAAALSEEARSRSGASLSQMIEDKAEQTRQAKAVAQAAAEPEAQAQPEAQEAAQDTENEAPVPEAESQEVAVPEAGASEQEAVAAASADDQGEDEPQAEQDPAAEEVAEVADTEDGAEEPAQEPSRRELLSDAVDTVTDAVTDVADLSEVPSSLTALADNAAQDGRPLSPREIVRAANAAARTRREAATAVVES
nr:twin-arginine translocase TatA/TatE family subunit [Actinomyces sp.]